jgi:hypothetical protein
MDRSVAIPAAMDRLQSSTFWTLNADLFSSLNLPAPLERP